MRPWWPRFSNEPPPSTCSEAYNLVYEALEGPNALDPNSEAYEAADVLLGHMGDWSDEAYQKAVSSECRVLKMRIPFIVYLAMAP